ncbi:MAG: hypothetical protein BAJATHORv1_30130 [Candidatus Thorarchaeota archaeon]|nr:MAG: hypothetical protein BAJATHORv1_30130 [Candidatus Thorarchaeota archaeon]
MTLTGIVTNIQRFSTEDGPGIRTTAFLKGCPLSCIWCQNPETIPKEIQLVWYEQKCIGDKACIEKCPERALTLSPNGMEISKEKCKICGTCVDICPTTALRFFGERWSVQNLVKELSKDQVFFETSNGGVTLSGGEALFQADFSISLASSLQNCGIHVALDTCGYYSSDVLERILPHIDLVLFDLKVMDEEKHREYTGGNLERILENARLIASENVPMWIRTPVIPGYTDTDDNIESIASFILDNLNNVERFDLLAFNRMCIEKYDVLGLDFVLSDGDLITTQEMERFVSIAKDVGLQNVVWSGMTQNDTPKKIRTEVETCGR